MQTNWLSWAEWSRSALDQRDPSLQAQVDALRVGLYQLRQESQRLQETTNVLRDVRSSLETAQQRTQALEHWMERLKGEAYQWSASVQTQGLAWKGEMEKRGKSNLTLSCELTRPVCRQAAFRGYQFFVMMHYKRPLPLLPNFRAY